MKTFSEPDQQKTSPLRWVARLTVLLVAVSACLVASVFLFSRWQEVRLGGIYELKRGAVDLNPLELLYLESYLALNADALKSSGSPAEEKLTFIIGPGETAEIIATNLRNAGLIGDVELFVRYVRYVGLDGQMEIGNYRLSPDMTIPDLATRLSQAGIQEVDIRFLEGWRISEMVEYLSVTRPANIDPQEFARMAEGTIPFDVSGYDFLRDKPEGSDLEGYLFPGSYRLPVDADAAYLIDIMLENFGQQVPDQLRTSFERNGLSIHEAITLASIIEKETSVEIEMPLMASVYTNRLSEGMLLQADPTVQYSIGYYVETDSWWKSPLSEADLSVDSPYNTYIYGGLPPGPITNPALAALQAVAAPAQTDYLFFVADCEAEIAGSHVFSRTFDEHLANVNRCRQ